MTQRCLGTPFLSGRVLGIWEEGDQRRTVSDVKLQQKLEEEDKR